LRPRKEKLALLVFLAAEHFHGASRSEDFGPHVDELAELSNPAWLTYVPTISRPWEEATWQRDTGRVEDIVRKHADRLAFDSTNTVAYVCGHPQMVTNVKSILGRARFPERQIRQEQYFALRPDHVDQRRSSEHMIEQKAHV